MAGAPGWYGRMRRCPLPTSRRDFIKAFTMLAALPALVMVKVGPWRTMKTPYLRKAGIDPRWVVVNKGAQIGGTARLVFVDPKQTTKLRSRPLGKGMLEESSPDEWGTPDETWGEWKRRRRL